ncbi:hypothetical protein PF011_g13886 [Phytophthora fragariae]|uniref:Uncharacterized protein n=1 Tax=Phytophthora fragariae TaxID=53985 RepID=A0A6A3K6C5_9STRA|nr:hypothetical protein PF011_g13886 [Phytophthora fragariae]KAE9334615.1 hypothetical protein PF008_g13875 [Phytophthora fragariae]
MRLAAGSGAHSKRTGRRSGAAICAVAVSVALQDPRVPVCRRGSPCLRIHTSRPTCTSMSAGIATPAHANTAIRRRIGAFSGSSDGRGPATHASDGWRRGRASRHEQQKRRASSVVFCALNEYCSKRCDGITHIIICRFSTSI